MSLDIPKLAKLVTDQNGHDKLMKCVQYGARFLAWFIARSDPKSDLAARFKSLFAYVRDARKLVRVLKQLSEAQKIQVLLKAPQSLKQALGIIAALGFAAYWTFDNIVFLSNAKFITVTNKDSINKASARLSVLFLSWAHFLIVVPCSAGSLPSLPLWRAMASRCPRTSLLKNVLRRSSASLLLHRVVHRARALRALLHNRSNPPSLRNNLLHCALNVPLSISTLLSRLVICALHRTAGICRSTSWEPISTMVLLAWVALSQEQSSFTRLGRSCKLSLFSQKFLRVRSKLRTRCSVFSALESDRRHLFPSSLVCVTCNLAKTQIFAEPRHRMDVGCHRLDGALFVYSIIILRSK